MKKFYKCLNPGARYKYIGTYLNHNDEYIIGRGEEKLFLLINLRTGDRYHNGTANLNEVFRSDEHNFVRINS